ncbi:hypothetical protein N2152v2_006830 [Parachlorella kessleri]
MESKEMDNHSEDKAPWGNPLETPLASCAQGGLQGGLISKLCCSKLSPDYGLSALVTLLQSTLSKAAQQPLDERSAHLWRAASETSKIIRALFNEAYVEFFSILAFWVFYKQKSVPSLTLCEVLGREGESVARALLSTGMGAMLRLVSRFVREGTQDPTTFTHAAKVACSLACPELQPALEQYYLGKFTVPTATLARLGIGAAAQGKLSSGQKELLRLALEALQRLCRLLARLQSRLVQSPRAAGAILLAVRLTAAHLLTTLRTYLPQLGTPTGLQPPGQPQLQQPQLQERQRQVLVQLLASCLVSLGGCMGVFFTAVGGGTAKLSPVLDVLCRKAQPSSELAAAQQHQQQVLLDQELCCNLQRIAWEASAGVLTLVEGVLGLLAAHHTSLRLCASQPGCSSSSELLDQAAQVAGSLVPLMRLQLRAWQLHPGASGPGVGPGQLSLQGLCVQTAGLLTMLRKAILVPELSKNSLLGDDLVVAAKFAEHLLDAAGSRLAHLGPGTRRIISELSLSASRALSTAVSLGTFELVLSHELSALGIFIAAKGCWAGRALRAEAEDAAAYREPGALRAAVGTSQRLCKIPGGALLALESGFVVEQALVLCRHVEINMLWPEKDWIKEARRGLAEIVSSCCKSLDELLGSGRRFVEANDAIDVDVKASLRKALRELTSNGRGPASSNSKDSAGNMSPAMRRGMLQGWQTRAQSLLPQMAYTLRAASRLHMMPSSQLQRAEAADSHHVPAELRPTTLTIPTAPSSSQAAHVVVPQQQEEQAQQLCLQRASRQEQKTHEQQGAEQQTRPASLKKPRVPATAVELALACASAGLCGNAQCKTLAIPAYNLVARKAPALRCAGCRIVTYCCGTGQVAVGLAQDFEQVLGLDSAQAQIQHAAARPNIIYRVAPAEATRLEAQSVDLVVAAQCMHWFDIPAFYRECRRILRPRGSLAVFGYMPTKVYFPDSTEAGEVLNRLHAKLHHYFHEKRQRFFLQHYEGQVPTGEDFEVVETTIINMERHLSIEQLVGWVRSMSGWASYKEQHGEASMERVLHQLQADLLQALCLTNEHTPVVSVWPLTTILAKQPVPVE